MAANHQAKVMSPEEVKHLRYPIPESMKRAAGLLKRHKKALEHHLQTVRREWNRSPKHDH